MKISRLADARHYVAPNHFDIRSMRLAGFEKDGPANFSVGLSHILPAGGAGPDSSPLEKVYVVLAGKLTITSGDRTEILGPYDTCTIAPDEERTIKNEGNEMVSMLVVMPYPPGADPHKG